MFVLLLFPQKQDRFKIQSQPHAFHVGIQLHHFVIRHQAAIQPDKLLCIIHFFSVSINYNAKEHKKEIGRCSQKQAIVNKYFVSLPGHFVSSYDYAIYKLLFNYLIFY